MISSTPGTRGGWNSSWYDRPLEEILFDKMSTKIPGQVEPSAANPPDKKAVIDGKLNNRVQGLLPLVQHYVQLLSLSYRPANALLFPPLTISVPTSGTRPEGIHVCIQVCPDYQKPCATLTRQRRVSPDSKQCCDK